MYLQELEVILDSLFHLHYFSYFQLLPVTSLELYNEVAHILQLEVHSCFYPCLTFDLVRDSIKSTGGSLYSKVLIFNYLLFNSIFIDVLETP